jgi:hypothetical protein
LEFVGASNNYYLLLNTLWIKMFLKAQGYCIHSQENYFEQDNKSAIKVKKNGRTLAGQKSRHIKKS